MISRVFVRDTGDEARHKVGNEAKGRAIQPVIGRNVGLAELHFVAFQAQLRVSSAAPLVTTKIRKRSLMSSFGKNPFRSSWHLCLGGSRG
jgi:hypothetical protein